MPKEAYCELCGVKFELPTTRGRPYKRCEVCRVNPKATEIKVKLDAEEIVDRLELNLKSRNLHISQHRDKWE